MQLSIDTFKGVHIVSGCQEMITKLVITTGSFVKRRKCLRQYVMMEVDYVYTLE